MCHQAVRVFGQDGFVGSDLEATAFSIADNRTHEFAEWDEPALARLLEELRAEDGLDGVDRTSTPLLRRGPRGSPGTHLTLLLCS